MQKKLSDTKNKTYKGTLFSRSSSKNDFNFLNETNNGEVKYRVNIFEKATK